MTDDINEKWMQTVNDTLFFIMDTMEKHAIQILAILERLKGDTNE